jgi:hypothetical protein
MFSNGAAPVPSITVTLTIATRSALAEFCTGGTDVSAPAVTRDEGSA